jgi:hypothetical protein
MTVGSQNKREDPELYEKLSHSKDGDQVFERAVANANDV